MNLKTLKKEMFKTKKTDPKKSLVLNMLIDKTQKIAKAEKREALDSDIPKAAKKMTKEAQETLKFLNQAGKDTAEIDNEITILSDFLPKTLSKEETVSVIGKIKDEIGSTAMSDVMKELKARYGDQVDMKLASSILKER